MKTSTSYLLILLVLITSCKTANPRLTNSHAGKFKVKDEIEIKNADKDKFIEVKAAVVPVVEKTASPIERKTFFDLRDSIPITYLKVLGDKVTSGNGANLIKLLQEPLSKEPKPKSSSLKTDFASQKVRFVLGNIKNYQIEAIKGKDEFLHPNTRLVSLNTTLNFEGTDFYIVSLDKLASEFEIIDLGNLSRNQEASFTSKLTGQYGLNNTNTNNNSTENDLDYSTNFSENSTKNVYDEDGNLLGSFNLTEQNAGTAGSSNSQSNLKTRGISAGINGEIGYNNKETIAEALGIKLKRLKAGFVFDKNSITISQHGSNLLDVSDNVILTATILPKSIKTDAIQNFTGLFKEGEPNNASEIKISRREIKYFECESKNVGVKVSAKGTIRTVANKMRGDNTLEFDDKVIYYPFSLEEGISETQINYWPNCTEIYSIRHEDSSGKKYILKAGFGSIYDIHLKNGEKDDLFNWLSLVLKNPTIEKLRHPYIEIYFQEIVSPGQTFQKIQIVGPSMTQQDVDAIKNLPFRFEKIIK